MILPPKLKVFELDIIHVRRESRGAIFMPSLEKSQSLHTFKAHSMIYCYESIKQFIIECISLQTLCLNVMCFRSGDILWLSTLRNLKDLTLQSCWHYNNDDSDIDGTGLQISELLQCRNLRRLSIINCRIFQSEINVLKETENMGCTVELSDVDVE